MQSESRFNIFLNKAAMAAHLAFLSLCILLNLENLFAQNVPVNCTKVYRNVQRQGPFIAGQLTIPANLARDDSAVGEGFKLQLSLNKAVRSVHVRQAKAREMGSSHMKFMIDTTPKEGTIKLDTVIRLRSGFRQHPARVVRVVYNGKALCGAPLTQSEEDESVTVSADRIKTTTTRPTSPILAKDFDEYYD